MFPLPIPLPLPTQNLPSRAHLPFPKSLNNEFQVKIKPHIDAVAREKGLDIILDAQVTLSVNKEFDISRDVIVKADDAEKATKGAAGGAAAAKPSGPAAAKPAPVPPPKP